MARHEIGGRPARADRYEAMMLSGIPRVELRVAGEIAETFTFQVTEEAFVGDGAAAQPGS